MSTAANPTTIHVLVVEDHEDDFRYLAFLLGRSGTANYHLSWASSYAAGQAMLRQGGFDVGLFDYRLGGGTGLDLLREAHETGCTIPIILLTGHDSAEVDQEASQAGAADYLCKTGLTGTELERTIRYAMRHAAMTTALRQSQQQLELFMRSVPCAVGIRDQQGQLLFQNELFARYFKDGGLLERVGPSSFVEALPYSQGDRHWLVNSFAMVNAEGQRLQGFAAIDISERVRMENELRRTTSLLSSIMRSLPAIAGRLDASGRVVEAQGSGLDRTGLAPENLLGRVFAAQYPPSAMAIAQALQGESANFSLTGKVGAQEWQVEFFVTADSDRAGGAAFFGRDVTERRWLEQRLLTISDAEQQRIGADLHDGLGQQLTGMACLAAALRDRLKKTTPAEAENADLIARLASESVAQSRALARGLCPVQLEKNSLTSALEDLTYQAQLLHGSECRFRAEGAPPQCEHLAAIHLYRITQEAIHNAARHGGAKHILVHLAPKAGQYCLTIKDDGRGFDLNAARAATGSGLRLMSYRANMIGGTFSAESSPERGTQVSVLFTSASAK
ncbi:hybrid sensor histidine kinase/response regulator [Opitutus terrae]|uniref:Multi-sensor signal transduction histidine kinase n=1 Tax=Opitutus terrae (strain DSM 11246 / JCM 15787 / PB90-1) TaxID=452637 RepID=B1ZWL1_OPITP|nr:response regulator [Opitutus terrae]ACB73335.1 multi-sensor signal transduction histidine kinase [Opitutus terrae PB90-1]